MHCYWLVGILTTQYSILVFMSRYMGYNMYTTYLIGCTCQSWLTTRADAGFMIALVGTDQTVLFWARYLNELLSPQNQLTLSYARNFITRNQPHASVKHGAPRNTPNHNTYFLWMANLYLSSTTYDMWIESSWNFNFCMNN